MTLQGVKFEKLYLKWDKALLIQIEKIDFTHIQTDDTATTLDPLRNVPNIVHNIDRWIDKIDIKNIRYKTLNGSFHYKKNNPGKITLRDENLSCDSSFIFHNDLFYLDAPKCSVDDASIQLTLTVPLNDKRLYADIEFKLPSTPTLFVSAKGDNDSLSFSIKSNERLSTVVPIVDFFGVDKETRPWIADYAKGSSILLESLKGKFHYDSPDELLYSLKAEATVENGAYTFAQGFDPILASKVKLYFKNGKLYILPIKGSFYNIPTEKSYLIIDFTRTPNIIDIFLSTKNAILNDPILNLLHSYKIDVPIKQTSGKCSVDLNLSVDLHTFETKAHGIFQPTPSNFLLHSFPFSAQNGRVTLDNANVSFTNFDATYDKNKINAHVNGYYNASKGEGEVNVDGYNINPFSDPSRLSLWNSQSPLSLKYLISSKGDELIVLPSTWNLNGEKLRLNGFKAPFDFERSEGKLPKVAFAYTNRVQGNFDGYINLNQKNSYINFVFDTINLNGFMLNDSPLRATLLYKNDLLTLTANNTTSWRFEENPLLISPFTLKYINRTLSIEPFEFMVSDLFKGKMEGKYLTDKQFGHAKLHSLNPINSDLRTWIDPNIPIQFTIDGTKRDLEFESNRLNASFIYLPEGWKLSLNDLSIIAKYSPKLRKYHLDNGNINLWYSSKRSNYAFQGSIHYPYSLIMINEQPIHDYNFNGTYHEGESHIRINNKIRIISNRDKTRVQAERIGINAPQLSKLLDNDDKSENLVSKSNVASVPWLIELSDSYVYLMNNRKITADRLEALYKDQMFNATLLHSNGSATLKLKNGFYSIEGDHFNDEFMKNLFNMKDFSGGEFSFQIQGSDEHLNGVLRVENTILKNYKLLNNVLAFVNTVPSLTTFSLPNYNTKGLPVKEGYAYFTYNNNIVNVENFTLNSPEIKLIGSGKGDLNNQSLNGMLTLKTDIGSAIGKVPVVGYILFGNDGSVSTTLTISGKIDNPKIETSITKEIVSTPFNILKRTFNYPFSWMKSDPKKQLEPNEQNSASNE